MELCFTSPIEFEICLRDVWKIYTLFVFDVLFVVFYFRGNGVGMNFKNDQSFASWTDCNDFTYVHSSITLSVRRKVSAFMSFSYQNCELGSCNSRKWTKLQVRSCVLLQPKNDHRYWCHLDRYEHSVRTWRTTRRIKLSSWLHLKANRSKSACSSRSALKILKSIQFTLVSPLEISKLSHWCGSDECSTSRICIRMVQIRGCLPRRPSSSRSVSCAFTRTELYRGKTSGVTFRICCRWPLAYSRPSRVPVCWICCVKVPLRIGLLLTAVRRCNYEVDRTVSSSRSIDHICW